MWPFKKSTQPTGDTVQFKIDGMHCVSCSMNIDGALEDTKGVISATTNYAKVMTTVTFDPQKITVPQIQAIIVGTGYGARPI